MEKDVLATAWRTQLITNLIATFTGVILALAISDRYNIRNEKKLLMVLCLQAASDLYHESAAIESSLQAQGLGSERFLDTRCFDDLAISAVLAKHSAELSVLFRSERRLMNMQRALMYPVGSEKPMAERLGEAQYYLDLIRLSRESLKVAANCFAGEISENDMTDRAVEISKHLTKSEAAARAKKDY